MEWITPAGIVGVLGLTLGLWRWMITAIREIKETQVKMDAALRGYNGQGGVLQDVEHVKRDLATVDERITKSRHDIRNAIQVDLMKLEENIDAHFVRFEHHLDQRFADLGIKRQRGD